MSEDEESEATNPDNPPSSSKDEECNPKKFDIRKHTPTELSNSDKVDAIFRELQVQRQKIEQIENGTNENGFDISQLNSFTVTENGEPTEDANKFRKEVIKEGKEGLTTSDIEGKLDVSNPTASSKMKQMAEAFEDLEVYNPRNNKKKPRYNQPKRLRHKGVARKDKSVKEVLQEERDKEMLECPKCPEEKGVSNSRKVWKKLDWECPNCESDLRNSF